MIARQIPHRDRRTFARRSTAVFEQPHSIAFDPARIHSPTSAASGAWSDFPFSGSFLPFWLQSLAARLELHADADISDPTWDDLVAHFSTEQLLDILFTVGQYNMVSMVLNTLGVQPEESEAGAPFPQMPER